MRTVNREEPVTRSHFIDCPSCKTHTIKLNELSKSDDARAAHESYKIVIVYVKEGKSKPATKTLTAYPAPSPDATLPSWQVPSDSYSL